MGKPPTSTSPSGNGCRPFRLLDLTLCSPVENLALDDALLEELEHSGKDPVLRLWESDCYFVVLGRACRPADDVHVDVCEQDDIPVLRRASGGGTVLQGPGCLSYALVLPLTLHADLGNIRSTNLFVLTRMAAALQRWHPAVAFRGISDLAIAGFKISGNAQRRTRRAVLFHGTVLHNLPADLVARYLKQPARQPEYRQGRPHAEFLSRLDAPPHALKEAIADVWDARVALVDWPRDRLPGAIANVMARSRESRA